MKKIIFVLIVIFYFFKINAQNNCDSLKKEIKYSFSTSVMPIFEMLGFKTNNTNFNAQLKKHNNNNVLKLCFYGNYYNSDKQINYPTMYHMYDTSNEMSIFFNTKSKYQIGIGYEKHKPFSGKIEYYYGIEAKFGFGSYYYYEYDFNFTNQDSSYNSFNKYITDYKTYIISLCPIVGIEFPVYDNFSAGMHGIYDCSIIKDREINYNDDNYSFPMLESDFFVSVNLHYYF